MKGKHTPNRSGRAEHVIELQAVRQHGHTHLRRDRCSDVRRAMPSEPMWHGGAASAESPRALAVSLTLARCVAGAIDRVGAALGRRARRVIGLNEGEAHT